MSPFHLLTLLLLTLLPLTRATPQPPRRMQPAPPPLYHAAPPASVFAVDNTPSGYEQLYRSYLVPLQLYAPRPEHYAPQGSPRGRAALLPNYAAYQHFVREHPAYISPDAGHTVPALVARMTAITDAQHAARRDKQRAFLALFTELGQQAKVEMKNALHPENLTSQHVTPLEELQGKYKLLLDPLERRENVERLTSHLDEEERERFLETVNVLSAESKLLEAAQRYATRFPHV
ncbi:conserved hypothetical Ustilaginaceae-specific protein [Sporisorium reilianum SRZ2]|uniref:Conserved hypothetical Ustilaginaceae-specific protein n=1 Tax=Sporisorium reilianum (strain SRZ2) TaxID=999809 RepID=E7A2C4_SPORE|nr:conserved hypothetical Ustilaginaceae-specific protein [Sporisorium reilianum SRZ2]